MVEYVRHAFHTYATKMCAFVFTTVLRTCVDKVTSKHNVHSMYQRLINDSHAFFSIDGHPFDFLVFATAISSRPRGPYRNRDILVEGSNRLKV